MGMVVGVGCGSIPFGRISWVDDGLAARALRFAVVGIVRRLRTESKICL